MTAYHMERGLALCPSVLACSTAKPKLSRSPAPMHVSVRNASCSLRAPCASLGWAMQRSRAEEALLPAMRTSSGKHAC